MVIHAFIYTAVFCEKAHSVTSCRDVLDRPTTACSAKNTQKNRTLT